MARKINAVLHDFVDENDGSSSDEDECISVEFDVEVNVLPDVAMENVQMKLHGGADVGNLHVWQLSDEAGYHAQ
jgi:hypothetical protein